MVVLPVSLYPVFCLPPRLPSLSHTHIRCARVNSIENKDFSKTGVVCDSSGNGAPDSAVLDLTPHEVSAEVGLVLSGEHATGVYAGDDAAHTQCTFGCIRLPATQFSGVACSAFVRFRVTGDAQDEATLLCTCATDCVCVWGGGGGGGGAYCVWCMYIAVFISY